MIDERNTAIITYMDTYFVENFEQDFLMSLFDKAKYKGKIVVLNYGMEEDDVERLKQRFHIEVYDCNKIMPVFSNRYRDIPKVIDNLEENITHVMTIDSGDIWFQDKIDYLFDNSINGIGCVEEERIIGEDDFTNQCMNKMQVDEKSKILKELFGKTVRNSGVICGPRKLMKKIVSKVSEDIQNSSTEFFGVDQIYFNYEWYALEEEQRVVLDELCNFVMVTNVDRYVERDGYIFTDKDKLVTVVHNAGANWRVLKRPFENKSINQEQYTETRVTNSSRMKS